MKNKRIWFVKVTLYRENITFDLEFIQAYFLIKKEAIKHVKHLKEGLIKEKHGELLLWKSYGKGAIELPDHHAFFMFEICSRIIFESSEDWINYNKINYKANSNYDDDLCQNC